MIKGFLAKHKKALLLDTTHTTFGLNKPVADNSSQIDQTHMLSQDLQSQLCLQNIQQIINSNLPSRIQQMYKRQRQKQQLIKERMLLKQQLMREKQINQQLKKRSLKDPAIYVSNLNKLSKANNQSVSFAKGKNNLALISSISTPPKTVIEVNKQKQMINNKINKLEQQITYFQQQILLPLQCHKQQLQNTKSLTEANIVQYNDVIKQHFFELIDLKAAYQPQFKQITLEEIMIQAQYLRRGLYETEGSNGEKLCPSQQKNDDQKAYNKQNLLRIQNLIIFMTNLVRQQRQELKNVIDLIRKKNKEIMKVKNQIQRKNKELNLLLQIKLKELTQQQSQLQENFIKRQDEYKNFLSLPKRSSQLSNLMANNASNNNESTQIQFKSRYHPTNLSHQTFEQKQVSPKSKPLLRAQKQNCISQDADEKVNQIISKLYKISKQITGSTNQLQMHKILSSKQDNTGQHQSQSCQDKFILKLNCLEQFLESSNTKNKRIISGMGGRQTQQELQVKETNIHQDDQNQNSQASNYQNNQRLLQLIYIKKLAQQIQTQEKLVQQQYNNVLALHKKQSKICDEFNQNVDVYHKKTVEQKQVCDKFNNFDIVHKKLAEGKKYMKMQDLKREFNVLEKERKLIQDRAAKDKGEVELLEKEIEQNKRRVKKLQKEMNKKKMFLKNYISKNKDMFTVKNGSVYLNDCEGRK